MRKALLAAFAAAAFFGCSMHSLDLRLNKGASAEVIQSDRRTLESQTMSALAAIERSLNDYIRSRRSIPKSLEELVPDFLAEIPAVELGLPGYAPTASVTHYAASVIVDGQINGAALEDSGGWGYAYGDRQVIVFVDCTRKRMDGKFWYQARGVY